MDNIVNFADKKRSSLLMHFATTKSKLIRSQSEERKISLGANDIP